MRSEFERHKNLDPYQLDLLKLELHRQDHKKYTRVPTDHLRRLMHDYDLAKCLMAEHCCEGDENREIPGGTG